MALSLLLGGIGVDSATSPSCQTASSMFRLPRDRRTLFGSRATAPLLLVEEMIKANAPFRPCPACVNHIKESPTVSVLFSSGVWLRSRSLLSSSPPYLLGPALVCHILICFIRRSYSVGYMEAVPMSVSASVCLPVSFCVHAYHTQ